PTRNAQSLREVLRPHGRDLSCASFDRNETCDLHRVSSLLTPWPARCRKSMAAAIPILARDAGKERATTSARSSGLENGFAIRASLGHATNELRRSHLYVQVLRSVSASRSSASCPRQAWPRLLPRARRGSRASS